MSARHSSSNAALRRAVVLAGTEPLRTLAGAGALAAGLPLLAAAPRGEPHPVLVLPGWLASDASTRPLRAWIARLGHPVVGWALGRNRGPTQEVMDELPRLLDRLVGEHGGPVSIVGWSLGGIYARRLAVRAPRHVRQVISLGSPFALPAGSVDGGPGTWAFPRSSAPRAVGRVGSRLARPLPVPSTAVYSRWDGVVDWRACRQQPGPTSENVAVRSSHLGMGIDPAVLWVVADRLAQRADTWNAFRRPSRFGLGALFPPED